MAYLFLFIFGLLIGSFLNVVSLRYVPGERLLDSKRLGGRSLCPHCRKELRWRELIPLVSFIIQLGRCRSCGKPISFQYPLVEFLSGLIFVLVPLELAQNFQSTAQLSDYPISQLLTVGIWILTFELFLTLSVIDFRKYLIPDGINLLLAFLGILLITIQIVANQFNPISSLFLKSYALIFGLRENIWLNHLFAALFGTIIFGAIIVLSRGKAMGWGDLKLAFALGLIFGWPEIILVLALSFIIGAVVSLGLMIKGRKTIKDIVPFGPFLVLGSAATFFFGYQITHYYFQFFSSYLKL